MTKSNHRANVVRIQEILKHPNADRLGIVHVGGYQCVVRLEDFQPGDLAVYVQPDSVVPDNETFAFVHGLGPNDGRPVSEKYRRVTARRFRKEWSEGLLIALPSHDKGMRRVSDYNLQEGDDAAELLGITHYEPPADKEGTTGDCERGPGYSRWPRSLKGWAYFLLRLIGIDLNGATGGFSERGPGAARPVYDVDAYKNFLGALVPGEAVVITEKIHGCNARYTFEGGRMYAGSRRLWKSAKSTCIWRRALAQIPWIEEWCRAYPGYTLYGEVVPVHAGYDYGCVPGQVKFFVFDILTPNGTWANGSEWQPGKHDRERGVMYSAWVPVLYHGKFEGPILAACAAGPSKVRGAEHIREGAVIRPIDEREVRGLGRVQLKVVSNAFLEREERLDFAQSI